MKSDYDAIHNNITSFVETPQWSFSPFARKSSLEYFPSKKTPQLTPLYYLKKEAQSNTLRYIIDYIIYFCYPQKGDNVFR